MLQQQVSERRKLNVDNQTNNEELEQYGRRLFLRIDGFPLNNNETSKDVLYSINDLFELLEVNIPDVVVDHKHNIGFIYKEYAINKNCKGIIVRFTTFRHRTMLYRVRSKLKGVKVRLDLTKSWHDSLSNANFKQILAIRFCYVDVGYRVKAKFTGERQDDVFFSSVDKLRNITVR